ncbi:regulatory protein AfsR [Reticulibacter mediterranei]|uniref:Regulatory protein AfsR n=1 Tax=Reticulibacter mediterranei TaxID=2778369 RepID=A0A8J3INL3_9CHLR|nr:NB-ARC domain-containing protein [Reticulibacter mediterranei]GHO98969.1 regulatory protein AfsR [Reticulibacter mediterranei]
MPGKKAAQARPNPLLRRARLEQGWSQQEVANRVGASQAHMVARWENGSAFPGPTYRKKLCELFAKNPQELGLVRQSLVEAQPTDSEASLQDPAIPLQALPLQRLVGRDRVLTKLREQLCGTGAVKRFAIEGLPGVGKTTLVAELALSPEVRTAFPEGVLWAGLGPQPNRQDHLRHWCSLLGITEAGQDAQREHERLAQALRQALWKRKMFLVLDDVWHIEDALACMVGGPDCTYLLTTRIPEVAVDFAGEKRLHLEELTQEESIRLLAQIAPMAHKMEPGQLASLAQKVGGLPLALTLMGNYLLLQARHRQHRRIRAALLQLQQAEARLRLEQPQAGFRRDPRLPEGMPLSLQAMIDLSGASLQEAERLALASLSILPPKPASFSEEAALAVMEASTEVLDRLVAVGLLEYRGTNRYSLHQTIATYARGLPRVEHVSEQRMITYVVRYAERHRAEYGALESELPLILAALELASGLGCQTEFVLCASAIFYMLRARGFFSLAERLLWQAYEIEKHREGERHLMLWYQLGSMLRERETCAQAETILEEGIALARQQGTLSSLAFLLARSATIAADRCAYTIAETRYQEALVLARQQNDVSCISLVLNNVAWLFAIRGDFALAEAGLQESLALARQTGKNSGIALANLGWMMGKQGKFAEASALLQEALSLARAASNDLLLSTFHLYLGWTQLRQNEDAQARYHVQEALSLARRMGRPRITRQASTLMAFLALREGNIESSEMLLQEALAAHQGDGHQSDRCLFFIVKGKMLMQQTQYVQACALLQEGLALASQIEHAEYRCGLLLLLSAAQQSLDDLKQASALRREGLALALRVGLPLPVDAGLGDSSGGRAQWNCRSYPIRRSIASLPRSPRWQGGERRNDASGK